MGNGKCEMENEENVRNGFGNMKWKMKREKEERGRRER